MKYKVTENGNIAVDKNGLPIVVNDDNSEIAIDAIHLYGAVTSLAEESKTRKEKIKELSTKLESYSGIEDPVAAAQALKDIETLKDVDLKNKGELDRIKEEMEDAWKGKMDNQKVEFEKALQSQDQLNNKLKEGLFKSMVATQFHQSPLFAGEDRSTTMSSNVAVKVFGDNFKVEETDEGENIVVGHINGKPIYSSERPGEIASFEEAIPRIIEASGEKIMKDSTGSGSGGGKGIFSGRVIDVKDTKSFGSNIEAIAAGKIKAQS